MNALIVALLLSQTPAQIKGALNSLYDAQANLSSRTITYPSGVHMACVPPAAGQSTVGAQTLRVGVLLISDSAQVALGATPLTTSTPVYEGNVLVRTDVSVTPWVYAAMEIQFFPDASTTPTPVIPPWMRLLPDTEVEVRAAPVWSGCQIAIVREGFSPMPYRCACSTGTACNYTPALAGGGFGASVPAPKDLTLQPGRFSGAGCVPKACVAWGDTNSFPQACR
jgi:hypothetical protein